MDETAPPNIIFKPGDIVRRKRAPESVGVVKESTWSDQIKEWYCAVRFGTSLKTVPATDLELLPEHVDPWADLIQGSFAGAEAFQMLMTFERLHKPPTRISGSFGSAKAEFLPFQFKPLLKFIENPTGRLLIADDVGLGKTIEAGYILQELQARHPLERVLIVVPARLRRKWRDELERRFEQKFDVINIKMLQSFLRKLDSAREPDSFSWIVSYESVRKEPIFDGLDRHRPSIDLIIFDEAHRLRNPETYQHRAARALAGCADSMIFLTATPIQTGMDNLFHLLNLLDPDAFANLSTFGAQLEANRPVIKALSALRGTNPEPDLAKSSLIRLQENPLTKSLTEGSFFSSIIQRLDMSSSLSREEAVRLQRDITELSLTAHIISRTRKSEVLLNYPQRKPNSLKFIFSAPERRFYDAVADLCRLTGLTGRERNTWGQQMALIMAFRMTSSCIPAAVNYFRERSQQGEGILYSALLQKEDLDDNISEPMAIDDNASTPLTPATNRFEKILNDIAPPPGIDTKYDILYKALREIFEEDNRDGRPIRKVIIFSFFKRTLTYLSSRLAEKRIDHRLITGDIAILEREEIIDEFLSNQKIKVLLSSEVGSEGLDLQMSSVVINYDLPWNPMVVEQRIGRVDRIGQRSPVVIIVNLIASDTIEERILLRLYERIRIFEQALGEIDPILGETVEELAKEALSCQLTPEEEEKKVEQAAKAFINQAEEARKVSSESDTLIAADQAFLDEIESLFGHRRVPIPEELYKFLRSFIMSRYPGSIIPESVMNEVGEIHLQPQLSNDMQNLPTMDIDIQRVAHKILKGPFLATFSNMAILQHPKAELIFMRHPLLLFSVKCMEKEADRIHRGFSLIIEDTQRFDKGYYIFSINQFEIGGFRPRTELVPLFIRLKDKQMLDPENSEDLMVLMLEKPLTNEEFQNSSEFDIQNTKQRLQEIFQGVLKNLKDREIGLNKARAERRRATIEATLRGKVEAARRRLDDLKQKQAQPFAIKMSQDRYAAEQRRLDVFLSETGEDGIFSIESREIAIGILKVGGDIQ